jgi:uncharacterized membrane protein YphA (DoxX/SURF4 family)
MQSLSLILRVILGLVLLAAAIGKLFNIKAFQAALEQYRLPYVGFLTYVVIVIEFAVGFSLLVSKAIAISSLVSLLLFTTILVLYTTVYNKTLNCGCGCFGSDKSVTINKYEIGKIILLMLLSATVLAFSLIHC